MTAIEKAIRDSDLGVNPTNDGQVLRVVFPQLTEERRRDLVKMARAKGEDAKVAIRNIRRRAKEELDRLVKDGEVGRGRRPPRGEGARRPHRPARAQHRRRGEEQGDRAARGLTPTVLRP